MQLIYGQVQLIYGKTPVYMQLIYGQVQLIYGQVQPFYGDVILIVYKYRESKCINHLNICKYVFCDLHTNDKKYGIFAMR